VTLRRKRVTLARTIEYPEMLNAKDTVCSILRPGWPVLESAYKKRLREIKKLFSHYDIFLTVTPFLQKDPYPFRSLF
jgi:hypothetical protein